MDIRETLKTFFFILLQAVLLLAVFMYLHQVRPTYHEYPGREKEELSAASGSTAFPSQEKSEPENAAGEQPDAAERFAIHFTEEVRVTENTYSSPNLSVTIEKYSSGEGRTALTYFVADIYVKDPAQMEACLSEEPMHLSHAEKLIRLATDKKAVLAINGDNTVYQHIDETSVTARKGELIRAGKASNLDILVQYSDGRMETFHPGEYDAEKLMEAGAVNIWHFGPSLLDENGAPEETVDQDYPGISFENPRTAVGYYEPGHYCYVVVDGRAIGYSKGMKLSELAELMSSLGCTVAYNLDGGASTQMYFNGKRINVQSNRSNRGVGDILYVTDPLYTDPVPVTTEAEG